MINHPVLVLCLGNPGRTYASTRHNAGFFVADRLHGLVGVRFRRRLFGRYSAAKYGCLTLAKPLTYMNRSGEVIESICRRYSLTRPMIIAVFDQMDLPPGSVRLKRGGGDGGHRGLRSVFSHAQSDDIWKLALGIGRPGAGTTVVEHVLSEPDGDERVLIDDAVEVAANTVLALCSRSPEELMNEVNGR